MTLIQLRYFVEICRTGSMQKATDKLNVSQSAISVAIRSLEKELGSQLFNRTAHGLELTGGGSELLARSEEILQRIDSIAEDFKKYSEKIPLFRIGIPPLISVANWPELFPLLARTVPNASFENVQKTKNTLLELLRARQIEAAILHLKDPQMELSGLEYCTLRPGYKQSAVMSIEHPLAANLSLTYEQLVHEPVIGYKEGESKLNLLKQIYSKYGVDLQYYQTCTQFSTMIFLVQKNMGIAYLNTSLPLRDYPDIVNIPIADFDNKSFIYLVWNKSDSKLFKKIRRVIVDYFLSEQTDNSGTVQS